MTESEILNKLFDISQEQCPGGLFDEFTRDQRVILVRLLAWLSEQLAEQSEQS